MDRDLYVEWMVATTPSTILGSVDHATLRSSLSADFDRTMASRYASGERAAAFAQRCRVQGAEPDDYRLREVRVSPDAAVLAGIHFKSMRVDHPFVGVFAQTRALSELEVSKASSLLEREFRCFAPKQVSWWSPEQHDLRGAPGAVSDMRLLVGRLSELALSAPSLPEGLEIERDSDGSSYPAYNEILDEFLAANPQWIDQLSRTDANLYVQCANTGSVLQLKAHGQVVGIAAARLGSVRGIAGWEIVDQILGKAVRGRALAPTFQRLLLATLRIEQSSLVFGTIDARNEPSRRTALSVGRKDVGGWVFVPAVQ